MNLQPAKPNENLLGQLMLLHSIPFAHFCPHCKYQAGTKMHGDFIVFITGKPSYLICVNCGLRFEITDIWWRTNLDAANGNWLCTPFFLLYHFGRWYQRLFYWILLTGRIIFNGKAW